MVADVAAADHGDGIVDDQGLVVHAVVDAGEIEEEIADMAAAERKGIEQADLDIGMRVDGGEAGILAFESEIVEEEAHAHPAVGSFEERAHQTPPAAIPRPEIVLRVDRLLRHGGKGIAALEGVPAGGDEFETRKAGMRLDVGGESTAEPRRLG